MPTSLNDPDDAPDLSTPEWRAKLADLDTEIAAKQKDIKTKVDEIGKR